jgi:hypothetical protein
MMIFGGNQAALRLDANDYGSAPTEREFDEVWSIFKQIRQLMEDAAADRDAVLVTVER